MSTIDPGVEDGIKHSADVVEDDKHGKEHSNTRALQQPSRWWFASTACPLLAGTFGPIASGFNICALVYHWRQYIPPGGTQSTSEQAGLTLPDPPFLIALNVASLVCALVGNASLLLNMAQRVRFSVAQPITIAGFLLAGFLLIADLAALGGSPHYAITRPEAIPNDRHSLTGAFYYAIFAAAIYVVIGGLLSITVYGASKGHYRKEFQLTGPQRTLMLQTMSFVAYLLIGALIYSHIEGWEYLNAVYWADVTLLTVGLGEYSPSTALGKGLLFPFAIGGILMVGLVVGSIRSLVLDRGKEKLSARIVERKRSKATRNVDERRQTIRISMFAKAEFSTDPALSQAQRRKEEFVAMRKVQDAGERERRWFGLGTSGAFALILWLAGAAIFQQTEYTQQWTYLQALYFAYTSLLTIGYGDYHPQSNSGKAFFVIWSLLAVPSLTILISNMGDTIVKWFSDITVSIAAVTVLPAATGFRAGIAAVVRDISRWARKGLSNTLVPGLSGNAPNHPKIKRHPTFHEDMMRDRLAERLTAHATHEAGVDDDENHSLEKDIHFYHYVLARECRRVQKDLGAKPAKRYSWEDWEYFLKLIGNEEEEEDSEAQSKPLMSARMRFPYNTQSKWWSPTPQQTRTDTDASALDTHPTTTEEDHSSHLPKSPTHKHHAHHHPAAHRHPSQAEKLLHDWSWLSSQSPLMSSKSEAEWILDRLSAALERELDRQRKGRRRHPPISLRDVRRRGEVGEKKGEVG
jgi:potassium channel subfamily K